MGMDTGLMALVMVVVALIVVGGLIAAVYLGVGALRSRERSPVEDSPRALLDRRLATGEISSEEYFERESALRSAEPFQPTRGR